MTGRTVAEVAARIRHTQSLTRWVLEDSKRLGLVVEADGRYQLSAKGWDAMRGFER